MTADPHHPVTGHLELDGYRQEHYEQMPHDMRVVLHVHLVRGKAVSDIYVVLDLLPSLVQLVHVFRFQLLRRDHDEVARLIEP